MIVSTRVMGAITIAALVLLSTSAAWASSPNDPRLTNFLSFDDYEVDDQGRVWGTVEQDVEGFDEFSKHLGQMIAPRIIAPSETLGQAGFAVKTMGSLSYIPDDSALRDGMAGQPSSMVFSSHLQVRKGLPFSFEVAGNISHVDSSDLFVMGADVRWALHEGYAYFPDIAARVSGNTLTGAPELVLFNVAWDLSMSKSFGLGGVMAITPYVGYQQLHTFSSSRKLNAYPQDPRPPQNLTTENLSFAPEAVFSHRRDNYRQMSHRMFLGARLNVWIVSLTLEGIYANPVRQFTLAAGVDF